MPFATGPSPPRSRPVAGGMVVDVYEGEATSKDTRVRTEKQPQERGVIRLLLIPRRLEACFQSWNGRLKWHGDTRGPGQLDPLVEGRSDHWDPFRCSRDISSSNVLAFCTSPVSITTIAPFMPTSAWT